MAKIVFGKCIHCGDMFKMEKDLNKIEQELCPYCRVVLLGEPDKTWLPSLKSDEIKGGGFHKV